MRKKEVQYKQHHGKKVNIKPKLAPKQWVFVCRPPLAGSRNTADEMATASYKKHQPRKAGPFRVIKERSPTIVIDEDGVPNTVSMHQITIALGWKETIKCRAPGLLDRTIHHRQRAMSNVNRTNECQKLSPERRARKRNLP